MPELRRDPVTGRWVVISTDRRKRPNDFRFDRATALGRDQCPFCAGREALTPPEILSYRQNGSAANGPGWDLRVVPNQYPALQVEGTLDRAAEGLFDRMNGIGAHEVIIETPDHDRTFSTMSEAEIDRVLGAYRERILDLERDLRFRYILIFKNQGAGAGATLEHTHSQLVALPIVPQLVQDEVDGARRHFDAKERCIFCDIVRQDLADGRRVVVENADVVALAPYAPRFAFETWLLPKRHGARFEDAPRHEYEGLARALKQVLQRMDRALETPPYNLVLHSAPLGVDAAACYHWHVELLPQVTRSSGFDLGTGSYINPTSPEEAAQVLRSVRV